MLTCQTIKGRGGGLGDPEGGRGDNTLEGVAFKPMLYLPVKEGVKGERGREKGRGREGGGEKKECNQ